MGIDVLLTILAFLSSLKPLSILFSPPPNNCVITMDASQPLFQYINNAHGPLTSSARPISNAQ